MTKPRCSRWGSRQRGTPPFHSAGGSRCGPWALDCPLSPPRRSPSLLAEPLPAHNLSHQSLFLRSRCFPMSAGPLTKQRWRTLLFFKVLHMKLPSLLSFPLPTPTLRVPWDAVPCPILMVGKHILIDAPACLCDWVCVCVCSEPKWGCMQEWRSGTKAVSCIVFFAVGLMSHLSSQMDLDPGTPPESLAKTLMEGD